MNRCPLCNAPEGGRHATKCPSQNMGLPIHKNGVAIAPVGAITHALYKDSKNKRSFEQGMEFQDFVVEQMNKWGFYIQIHCSKKYQFDKGESVQRCEIKLDNRCTETGRLSIEVQERTSLNGAWVSSGIYREDNTVFYIQGNWCRFFVFAKKSLVDYHQRVRNGAYEQGPDTIRKFYLPLADAERLSIIDQKFDDIEE